MDGTVIPSSSVEQHEHFLKNNVGKLLRLLHLPSMLSCESVLT